MEGKYLRIITVDHFVCFDRFEYFTVWLLNFLKLKTRDQLIMDRELRYQQSLHHITQDISVIGLRYVFDPNRSWYRKLIWILLILFGVGLACYQIQDRISNYLKFPTATTVNILQANELRFPQVTICNENFVNKSAADKYGRIKI